MYNGNGEVSMDEYSKLFAKNLRHLRKGHEMTQVELGKAIGYSEKAVSKWEKGHSVPEIAVLFQLAQLFHTTVGAFFQSSDELYFLGIDGEGTSTEFLLTSGAKIPIRSAFERGCNPCDIGMSNTKEILKRGIYQVCQGVSPSRIVAFAGISGTGSVEYAKEIYSFMLGMGFYKVYNGSDVDNVVAAALGENDGVAVIIGTGIAAFTQKDRKKHCTAGWGHYFDQGGSTFNFGHDAIEAALMMEGKRGRKTLLYDLIMESTGCKPSQLIPRIYTEGRQYIASFAPLVFEAADRSDEVARDIIHRNFSVITEIIRVAAEPLKKKPVTVALSGELVQNKYTLPALSEQLDRSLYTLCPLTERPVLGAVENAVRCYRNDFER